MKGVKCMALSGGCTYYFRHKCSFKFCDDNVMCFGLSCLRASWMKESNPDAEQLFSMVSEVFIFWAKSHVRLTDNSVFYLFSYQYYPSQYFTL